MAFKIHHIATKKIVNSACCMHTTLRSKAVAAKFENESTLLLHSLQLFFCTFLVILVFLGGHIQQRDEDPVCNIALRWFILPLNLIQNLKLL